MITEEQRYKILTHLNFALIRSYEMRANYENFSGDLWHINAKLNPTEYQANRPVPLIFQKDDIWQRIDNIEAESPFLEAQLLQALEDLEATEANLKSTRGNGNYALVKADVLEWDVGLKLSGMESDRDEQIEKLRMLLSLPPTPGRGGGTPLQYG